MNLNLSIKNVPEATARRLRARAERHHRSLQGELMAILEAAALQEPMAAVAPAFGLEAMAAVPRGAATAPTLGLDQIVERARRRFPQGTSHLGRSVDIIRDMRDHRDGDRSTR